MAQSHIDELNRLSENYENTKNNAFENLLAIKNYLMQVEGASMVIAVDNSLSFIFLKKEFKISIQLATHFLKTQTGFIITTMEGQVGDWLMTHEFEKGGKVNGMDYDEFAEKYLGDFIHAIQYEKL